MASRPTSAPHAHCSPSTSPPRGAGAAVWLACLAIALQAPARSPEPGPAGPAGPAAASAPAAGSVSNETLIEQRARTIVVQFALAPDAWESVRRAPVSQLVRERDALRRSLAALQAESEALHARSRAAAPQPLAAQLAGLEPLLSERRRLAARLMLVALARRASEQP